MKFSLESPQLQEARAKYDKLHAQLQQTIAESQNPPITQRADDAQAILEGKPLAKLPEARDYPREIRALQKAMQITLENIETIKRQTEHSLLPEMRREYRAVLEKVIPAVTAAAKACDAEAKFRDDLTASGFSLNGLNPCPLRALGRLTDDSSPVSMWLREVNEYLKG